MMKLLSRRGRSSLRVLLAVDGGVRTDASVAGRSAGRAVLYGLGVARVVGVIARVVGAITRVVRTITRVVGAIARVVRVIAGVVGAIARVMRTITGVVRMIARVVGRGGALVRSAGVGMAVSVVGVGSVAVVVVAVAVAIVGVGSVAVVAVAAAVASVGPPLLGNGTRGRAHTSLVSLEDHSQRMGLSRIIIPSHSFTHLAASSWFSKVM